MAGHAERARSLSRLVSLSLHIINQYCGLPKINDLLVFSRFYKQALLLHEIMICKVSKDF